MVGFFVDQTTSVAKMPATFAPRRLTSACLSAAPPGSDTCPPWASGYWTQQQALTSIELWSAPSC